MNYNEFAEKIKNKYPEYKDFDNKELSQKIIAKYPEYESQVTFDDVETKKTNPVADFGKGVVQGLGSLPTAIGIKVGNKLRPLVGKKELTQEEIQQKVKQNPLSDIAFGKPETGAGKVGYTIGNLAPAFFLPEVKAIQGAGMLPKVANMGLTGAYQGGLVSGSDAIINNGGLGDVAMGTALGGGIGAALPAAAKGLNPLVQKTLNNPTFKQKVGGVVEALTSVPSKFTERALTKEFAGNSLFQGKFNPETAYRGIETKLKEAKSKLPSKEYYKDQYKKLGESARQKLNSSLKPESYFDEEYNKLGKEVLSSIDDLNAQAGEKVNEALIDLPENVLFNSDDLINEVNNVYNKYSLSGNPDLNVANNQAKTEFNKIKSLIEKGKGNNKTTEALTLENNLNNPVSPKELYDINKNVSAMTQWNNPNAGTANEILEQIYGNFSNKLSSLSPELAEANNLYSKILGVEKATGGLNPTTIANKLSDFNNSQQIRSGVNTAFEELNNLLPKDKQFLNRLNALNKQRANQQLLQSDITSSVLNDISRFDNAPYSTQDALIKVAPEEVANYTRLSQAQKYQDEMLKPINNANYERNPKLLANRNDLAAEEALDYLQKQSGINFMDDLNDIRARESLEAWLPGQGGGSGSAQGAANLVRSALGGSGLTAAATLHNPLLAAPFSLMLPQVGAKGTVKNLGRLYRLAGNQEVNPALQRVLPPIMAKTPLLYGGVEYNEGY